VTTLAALSVLLGSAYDAVARAEDAQVVRVGDNFDAVWTGGPRDNLVGGGTVRRDGGGDDATVTLVGPAMSGPRAFATLSGGGDDMTLRREAVPSGWDGRDTRLATATTAPSLRTSPR
jgi:hypothetical protein